MANISKQLLQRSVTRDYYLPYERMPNAREFIADVTSKVPQIQGWTLKDIDLVHRMDMPSQPWRVTALFEREMNTLEAKAQRDAEKSVGIQEDGRTDDAR